MGSLAAAGGLFADVSAVEAFIKLHFRLAGDATSNRHDAVVLAHAPFQRLEANHRWAYGLGRFVVEEDDGVTYNHGGDLDGYNTYVKYSLDDRFGMIILSTGGAGRAFGQFGNWLFSQALQSQRKGRRNSREHQG